METSIETIHEELVNMKKDIKFIKNAISENFELSNHAKKALKEARKTSESEYIEL